MQDYNSPLAILARDPGIDRAFTGYQVPNTNEYIITCKKGQAYSYFYCINEEVFIKSWKIRNSISFQEQAPPNIDYSIVTLQDAILEANMSASDTNDQIVTNQQTNISANHLQNELLQELNDRIPYQAGGRLPVSIDGPITLSGSTSISNFPDNQKVTVTNQPATYPVTGNFYPLTQPVSGSVTVSNFPNFPTTQSVSGSVAVTNFPASQPVTGPLTDTQLRANPLPVTVTFPGTQQVSGSIAINNYPTTQHVTVDNPVTTVAISNLPTTQVVSGTVAISNLSSGGLTDTQLRATALPVAVNFPTTQAVSGTINIGNYPLSQHVTVDNPTTSTTVTNFPTTQAVSLTTNTPDIVDRSSRLLGHVTVDNFPTQNTTVTVANPTTTVAVSNLPTTQSIAGTVAVSSVPAGLGTSSNQLIANVSLNSIDTKLTTVSTAALQSTLNGLVATSALQTAGNASLTSIDSKLTSPLSVVLSPRASGGLANRAVLVNQGTTLAASTTPTVVKASAGQLYTLDAFNESSSKRFLNVYNKATAPIATDIPVLVFVLFPSSALPHVDYSILGSYFPLGISLTITANNGLVGGLVGTLTGITVANEVTVNIGYA